MVKAQKYLLRKKFEGEPKESDLELVEEELPPLNEGEFLTEAIYLSVDPYMRAYVPNLNLNSTFIGGQVAKIIESKDPKFPVGRCVMNYTGWKSHAILKDRPTDPFVDRPFLLPDFGQLPLSLALGVLGMPGNTAYFGLLEICKPKPEETVAVTGAAGAVGSLVGQIAKIKGCKVIGIAGSDEKGKWLVDELKFDHFVNYKKPNFSKNLAQVAPKGIDCYFDNVGGEISSRVLRKMNDFGRISVCGAISEYNDQTNAKASSVQAPLVMKQLKMEGFNVKRWSNRWLEGIEQNKKWVEEGKLVYRETITEGFENMFKAFVGMLEGKNIGKAIVKVLKR